MTRKQREAAEDVLAEAARRLHTIPNNSGCRGCGREQGAQHRGGCLLSRPWLLDHADRVRARDK